MSETPPPEGRIPLAYENKAFLNSPDARTLRMLAEYFEPQARLRRENIQDTIVFFGSARIPAPDSPETGAAKELSHYYEDARALARMLTHWAVALPRRRRRFIITSGGGPGIMEAANRGASEAGGQTIGFNIRLPFEQHPNPFISPTLNFEFHYFFMRKFWFAYLAKALVAFPGGFGTLDEVMEILTLAQTHKLNKKIVIMLYGRKYWEQVVNFKALVDWGTIAASDLELFHFADSPQEAYEILTSELDTLYLKPSIPHEEETPAIAKTLG